jgi:hypothetical protein
MPFDDDWRAACEPTTDAMDVRSRMAMYRYLVERTNPHGALGPEAELSPF